VLNNLALVLDSQGKYEEAERIHRQELGLSEKVLGKVRPGILEQEIRVVRLRAGHIRLLLYSLFLILL
jgi:hypothetical protein